MRTTSFPLIIAILGAVGGLTPLAIDMYLPAIPTIAQSLASNTEQVQLTVSVYLLFFGLGQLIYGPITDALGRLKVMSFGLLVFITASLGCAWVSSVEMLLLMRGIQALGGAATSVVMMGYIRDRFKHNEFAQAMSVVMLVMQLAPLIAPVLGGYLLIWAGWQSLFGVLAIVAAVLMLAVWWGLGETMPASARQPLSFHYALRTYLSIIRHRTSFSYVLIGVINAGALFSFITSAPFVYIEYFKIAPEHFGYVFGINVVAMMCFTIINARFVSRFGSTAMLRFGVLTTATGGGLLVLGHVCFPMELWALMIPAMLVVGPLGLINANATSLALVPFGHASGSVAALGGFIRFTWGAIAGALVSAFHIGTPTPMVTMMALCGLGAVGLLFKLNRQILVSA
ncbi:MAG: Bcr/CflA family multidrug efflux MFS transporter [Ferrimonas sp.]